jgi:signal transduction histidine kinase/streptogramin lyase
MITRIAHLLALLSIFSFGTYSQTPVFRNYTTDNGLLSNTVYDVLEDKEGFIWFGTGAGVSRFDGSNFDNFNLSDGLTDLDVLFISQDLSGRIWFCTLNGVPCYYQNGEIHNSSTNPELGLVHMDSGISSVCEDMEGNLWFGSLNGKTARLSPENKVSEWYNYAGSLTFVIPGTDHNIYLFDDQKICRLDNDEFIPIDSLTNRSYHLAKSAAPSDCEVYFLSEKGIEYFKDGKRTTFFNQKELQRHANRLIVDRYKNIWILNSNNGISLFQKSDKDNQYLDPIVLLPNITVYSALLDSEGNSWICTNGKGVFMTVSNSSNITLQEIFEEPISYLKMDGDSILYVGTQYGNVSKIKDGKVTSIKESKTSTANENISKINITLNGDILISAVNASFIYKDSRLKNIQGRDQLTNVNMPNIASKNIASDKFGDIYISGYGIFKYDYKSNTASRYLPEIIGPNRSYSLFFDSSNNMWFENGAKLFCVRPNGEITSFPQFENEFQGRVSDIDELPDSTIVIGTYGNGIKFFKNGKILLSITEKDGLSSNACRQLVVSKNNVYVATSLGYTCIEYKDPTNYIVQKYTVADGISSNDIRAIEVDSRYIYLGTPVGLCKIKREFRKSHSAAPSIYLRSVHLNDSTIESKSLIELNNNYGILRMNFGVISFQAPEKIIYEYRINPYTSWTRINTPYIELNQLHPSRYNIQFRAKKHNSEWSEPFSIELFINKEWWQYNLVRLIFILVIFSIIFLVVRFLFQIKQRKEIAEYQKQESIALERLRISADLHDDLGADLSNLLLISRMAIKKTEEIQMPTEDHHKIEEITTQSLRKIDEIIWSLNPESDTLAELITFTEKYFVEFVSNGGYSYSSHLPTNVPEIEIGSTKKRNLFLSVKECLNNISKHAKADHVEIQFQIDSSELLIKISDNGKMSPPENKPGRNGLKNMSNRMEQIQGSIVIEYKENIGTTVILRSPI